MLSHPRARPCDVLTGRNQYVWNYDEVPYGKFDVELAAAPRFPLEVYLRPKYSDVCFRKRKFKYGDKSCPEALSRARRSKLNSVWLGLGKVCTSSYKQQGFEPGGGQCLNRALGRGVEFA